ncbi:MAG: signal peptidase II [Lachnospiraceae bacterium]|nr:signal peptidase II [Lachnospiraceae bacterium]
MEQKSKIKYYIFATLLLVVLVALDQWTKFLASDNLINAPYVLLEGVFELRYLENRGSAFGMFQNQVVFLLVVGIIVLGFALFYFVKLPWNKKMNTLRVLAVFIAAGGIGNMIDRTRLGYVVDFFYFKLINFPIFNVADIYVTVSMVVLFIMILFFFKEEELEAFSVLKKGKKTESSGKKE